LLAIPHAQAQPVQPFNAATCNQTMQTALYKGSQDRFAVEANNIANMVVSQINTQCIQGIMNAFNVLGQTTNLFSLIWGIIWTVIIMPMITNIINQVCQAIVGTVQAAVSFIKNAICIPLPGIPKIPLNLGTLAGKSCNGIALIPALTGFGAARPATPGTWKVWSK
jgi:hypothetical protein